MGYHERTEADRQADAFFNRFIDATPEVIAAVRNEARGDLAAIVAEDKAYGYWARFATARAARTAARQRAEWAERARQAAASPHLRHPDETARRPHLAPTTVTLPARRVVVLSDAERADTRRWWHRLDNEVAARALARRIRTEAADADQQPRRAARTHRAWQREQREFERAQWQAVISHRNARPQIKRDHQWIAIDEDRALQIAIAALEKQRPPQPRN